MANSTDAATSANAAMPADAALHAGDPPAIQLAGVSAGYRGRRVLHDIDLEIAPAERLVLVGPAVATFDMPPVAADTIVVHGEADEVVPLASVLDWARPQALPITVVPGAGHFFHGQLTLLKHIVTGAWHPRAPN